MALYPITPTVDALHRIGTALYGARYQVAMAEALHDVIGRPVTAVQVGRWTLGAREAPAWLRYALIDVARRGAADLRAKQSLVLGEIEGIRASIPELIAAAEIGATHDAYPHEKGRHMVTITHGAAKSLGVEEGKHGGYLILQLDTKKRAVELIYTDANLGSHAVVSSDADPKVPGLTVAHARQNLVSTALALLAFDLERHDG